MARPVVFDPVTDTVHRTATILTHNSTVAKSRRHAPHFSAFPPQHVIMAATPYVVRVAEEKDRDGILAISGAGIYGGHDYLTETLDDYMGDAKRTIFVAATPRDVSNGNPHGEEEDQEEIMGLDSVVLLPSPPERPSALFQALRIAEPHRGKGIASALTAACLDHVMGPANGSPSVLRITSFPTNTASVSMHQRRGYQLVAQRAFLVLPGSPDVWKMEEMGEGNGEGSGLEVVKMSASELADVVYDGDDPWGLGEGEEARLLLTDWVPLEGCREAVEALGAGGVASSLRPHEFWGVKDASTGQVVGFGYAVESPRFNGNERYWAAYVRSERKEGGGPIVAAVMEQVVLTLADEAYPAVTYISGYFGEEHRDHIKGVFGPRLCVVQDGDSESAAAVRYVDAKFDNTGGIVCLEKQLSPPANASLS